MRARVTSLVLVVVLFLSGCTGSPPATTNGDSDEPRTASFTAEDAFPSAARAVRDVDPSARLVAADPVPRGAPVVASEGDAPAWRFVFQVAVDTDDLEPRATYSTVTVNASTGVVDVESSAPSGFRVHARAPDGRAWIGVGWVGSAAAAAALASRELPDGTVLELAPDGCVRAASPAGPAEPAWVARATASGVSRVVAVSASTGDVCRDVVTSLDRLPVTVSASPAESDAMRGGAPSNASVRALTPDGTAPDALRLAASSLPGAEGALPRGLAVSFHPPTLEAGESVMSVAADDSATPGRYTFYVWALDESGRGSAGFTAVTVRVR